MAGLGGFELADDDFPDKHCLHATMMSPELIEKAELPNGSTDYKRAVAALGEKMEKCLKF